MMLIGGRPLPNDPRFLRTVEAGRHVDSAAVVRADLATRTLDTAAWIRVPKSRRELELDPQGLLASIQTTPDPLPLVDAWAVMPDGSIAIIRGLDYHVGWIDASGKLSSSPTMPFDWQRVSDERKQTLIDSTVKIWQAQFDQIVATRKRSSGGGGGGAVYPALDLYQTTRR